MDDGCQRITTSLKRNVRPMLTAISLARNGIQNIGSLQLGELLRANSSLTEMDLKVNSIGDEGARTLSVALGFNHTLTTLSLCQNEVGGSWHHHMQCFDVMGCIGGT
jgi:Ran GTPase-activating protein (RanGAP) involved in mRNA processing and transport